MTGADNASSNEKSDWIKPRRISRVTALRTSITSDMQVICGAGPYHLDLLVRELEDSSELKISGQITCSERSDEPVSGLKLFLVAGDPQVTEAETETDEFGEISLAVPRRRRLGLCVGDEQEGPRVLIWGDDEY